MATIQAELETYLFNKGLIEQDAHAVVEAMKADNEPMRQRWSDDAAGYIAPIMATLRVDADRAALQWIDANCPKHWARSMFVPA